MMNLRVLQFHEESENVDETAIAIAFQGCEKGCYSMMRNTSLMQTNVGSSIPWHRLRQLLFNDLLKIQKQMMESLFSRGQAWIDQKRSKCFSYKKQAKWAAFKEKDWNKLGFKFVSSKKV